jgi:hypothetical protein
MQNKHLLLTFIFFACGFLFLGLAGWFYLREYKLERSGYSAQGTVIHLSERISDEDSLTYAPVVRFTTHDGRTERFETSWSSYPPAYEVGQTVTVLYPTDDPSQAIIKGENNLLILIFGILGGIELLVGAFFGLKTFAANMYGET